MKRMPILTSGRQLVARGMTSPPYRDNGSDWAEVAVVEVTDADATLLGSYWSSGHRNFLATGDTAHLLQFDGVEIDGLPLMTSARLIEEFDEAFGHIDVREIYEQGF